MTDTTAASWDRLSEGAARLGMTLSEAQLRSFQRYTELLETANQQFNLTAVRDLPGIIVKLHLDSLALLPALANAAAMTIDELLAQPWRMIDVGSGAGIPGLPLRFAWPAAHLTLLDATAKKAKFLTRTLAELGIEGDVLAERAEVVGQDPNHRGKYDLVVARAVAALPTLVELTLPLTRSGGWVLLPKGPKAVDELAEARRAISVLGGTVVDLATVRVPFAEEGRTAVILRKTRPAPAAYPRRPGLPAQRPILEAEQPARNSAAKM